MTPAIGIDLGTTFSVVAARYPQSTGDIQILTDSQGHKTTPSYIDIKTLQCGHVAKAMQHINANTTLFDIKRLIGRDFHTLQQTDLQQFPFAVIDNGCNEPVIETSQGQFITPEEASSILLQHLKYNAESKLGCAVRNAVITVPAHFGDKQRHATRRAAEMAGLHVLRIVNEPTAAAIAHGIRRQKVGINDNNNDLKILVFDYGGGTLDVTVLVLDANGIFEVLSSGGDSHLGGEDIDVTLVEYCISKLSQANDVNMTEQVKIQIKHACETAKRQLSLVEVCDICVPELDFNCSISRTELEMLNNHHFDKCMHIVRNVIAKSRLLPAEIDEVVLVGGSSRIPCVQSLLSEIFDNSKPLRMSVDPDEAVALGAAILADMLDEDPSSSLKNKESRQVLLLDVTPLSLGFETDDGVMKVVVPSNHTIPTRKHQFVSTCYDNQQYITLKIFEGERVKTEHCHHLKSLTLGPLAKAPAGIPRIKVSFDVDENCMLTVTAQDTDDPTISKCITIRENFNDAITRDMKKDAHIHLDADKAEQKRLDAKSELATACRNLMKNFASVKERKEIQRIQNWVQENPSATADVYRRRLDQVLSLKSVLAKKLAAKI